MAVKELYTASERWFTDQAVSRQLITQEQVSKAVADQLMIRHQGFVIRKVALSECGKLWFSMA